MKKSVFFFLLISPIFYSTILSVSDIREQQFWVLLIGAAFFVGINHYNRIFGYAILYALAHLALFQRPAYLNNMAQILAHAIVYDTVARYYDGKNYKWALLAILSFNLALAALQATGNDFLLENTLVSKIDLQSSGLMTLPVYLGLYAAITAPIIFLINPWLIILSAAGIIFSRSSFAAIAFVVAMSFYFWQMRSRILKFWIPAVICALIYFVGFYDARTGQFERRLHIWKMASSVIAGNPWGGWGLGSYDHYIRFAEIGNSPSSRKYIVYQPHKKEQVDAFMNKIEQVAAEEFGEEKAKALYELQSLDETVNWFRKNGSDIYFWQDPHNGYLLAWFELGFPAVILIIWYCFDMWRRYRIKFASLAHPLMGKDFIALFSSFIATAIASFAHFAIQIPRLSFTIVILFAILDRRINGNFNTDKELFFSRT